MKRLDRASNSPVLPVERFGRLVSTPNPTEVYNAIV
jgi:hypothetical protein